MKRLTCEMCGSTDLLKQDGVFVCQSCGTKYSVEEAKKMMIEGTVDVSGSTIKIDTSGELANLYQIARRSKDNNDYENAIKYYEMILVQDPNSWEASFYPVYFKALRSTIAQIYSAGISVTNCLDTVLQLIRDNISDHNEQKLAYTEVANRVMHIAKRLYDAAQNHYNSLNSQEKAFYVHDWTSNGLAAMSCVYILGDDLDSLFQSDPEANKLSLAAWKQGVTWHQALMADVSDKDGNRKIINIMLSRIHKYDSTYMAPPEKNSYTAPQGGAGGCFVATAVYGSYDCPQVWTLRRYRDETLAGTLHGRVFIKLYYAVSPTLVKWFGQTNWFKKMWKGKLDNMVAQLQAKGVASTPYEDRAWK